MIPNDYKTSLRIASQLPEFIRDDANYQTFVMFVQAYYEWLETTGGVTEGIKNLQDYSDIDKTLDGFIEYFINDFLPFFPEDALADKRKILKIAKQLYQAKGTPGSYNLLFRLLYNSESSILETNDLVFRASAADWYTTNLLKLKSSDETWILAPIKNLKVFGETSKSFASIESVYLDTDKYDVYISSLERSFLSGENIKVVDNAKQDVYFYNNQIVSSNTPGSTILTGKLTGTVSSVAVDPKNLGLLYTKGDPVVFYGGLGPTGNVGATAEVDLFTSGAIQEINIVDAGYGYRVYPGSTITFTPQPKHPIVALVGAVNPIGGENVSFVVTDNIETYNLVSIGATAYGFPSNPTANLTNQLSSAFMMDSFGTYPLSKIVVVDGGSGFIQLPNTKITSTYDSSLGHKQDLSQLGILAPIQILANGVGYLVNDKIVFSGGAGTGAYANVTSVNIAGAITGISYVPNYLNSAEYSLGGLGYTSNSLPTLSINSSNVLAHGANVYVPAILGTGAQVSYKTDFSPNHNGEIISIKMDTYGEDYISPPNVSFRVQDLIVTGVTQYDKLIKGAKVFQGQDIDIPGNPEILNIDYAPYQSYIDSVTLIQDNINPALVVYKIRVYNYTITPNTTSDLANTIIQVDTEVYPYPTMNLTSDFDSTLNSSNGVITYGDGNAKGTAKFLNGLISSQGRYMTTVGHPSSESIIQSSIYNSYTYILSVESAVSKYRDILKKLLHPAGMQFVGRNLLKSAHSIAFNNLSGLQNVYSLQVATSNQNTYGTMISTDGVSTNAITIMDSQTSSHYSGNVSDLLTTNDYIAIYPQAGQAILSQVKSFDNSNSIITLTDNLFLQFANVFYGYANTILNVIQVSNFNIANTPNYDIVNNANYSNTTNHLYDIVFTGDSITLSGNTYTITSIDYINGNISVTGPTLYGGTQLNPLQMTINRTISTANIYIHKTL